MLLKDKLSIQICSYNKLCNSISFCMKIGDFTAAMEETNEGTTRRPKNKANNDHDMSE